MRIGIDATILESDKPTGMAFYAINLIREIAKLHDDVVVWTVMGDLLDVPSNAKRMVLQPFIKRKALLPWVRAVWTQLCLPILLLKERVDVFFSPIPEGILSPPVPQVLVVHDLVPLVCSGDAPFFRRLSFRTRVPLVLKASSHIIAVSESTKRDIIALYKIREEKISVVYEGYDDKHFMKMDPKSIQSTLENYDLSYKRYFLFVGNFTPRKNIHTLVEAFRYFADSGIDIPLILVGNQNIKRDYTKRVIGMIEDLNLKSKVRLLDYVPFTDLPALYNGASALVFLSFYEGFGLPVLEAMACGTPVVVTKSSSLPEVCGDKSTLSVSEGDKEGVVCAMLELSCNERLRMNMVHNVSRRSSQFSWKDAACRVLYIARHLYGE